LRAPRFIRLFKDAFFHPTQYCPKELSMQKFFSRNLSKFAASTAVAIALTAGVTSQAIAAPTASLFAGYTGVTLDAGFTSALTSLKVSLGTLPRTYSYQGQVYFPISGGAIDLANAKSEIIHTGGISLTAGATRVELSDFLIDTIEAKPVLTGIVVVNDSIVDRIPLFDIALPAGFTVPLAPRGRSLTISGAGLTLNATAAGALNSVFGVTAFAGGFTIGKATIQGFTVREH
jgi:hypothetical protein